MPPTSPWALNAKHDYNIKHGFPNLERAELEQGQVLAEEYRTRQDDEVEALRSIFMEEFQEVDVGAGAWSRSAERAFKLNLTAYSDPETAVTLSVTLTSTYPKSLPLLKLSDAEHLRQSSQASITEILQTIPKSLTGSEMIYDIAAPIRDVLEEAVQAKIRGEGLPSLEQERAIKEAEAAKTEEARKGEMDRQREEARHEEERVLEQMMLEEVDRQRRRLQANRRQSTLISIDDQSSEEAMEGGPDRIYFDRIETKDEDDNPITFRTVSGCIRLRQGPVTEVCTVSPIVQGEYRASVVLVLKQVKFISTGPKKADLRHDVLELETELENLRKLRFNPHPNVLQVLAFKVDKQPALDEGGFGSWRICVLAEHANKGSLEELLDMVGPLGLGKVRAWTIQLLEALEYLHCSGIVHGLVHTENILLTRAGAGDTIIKLADGGYQRQLHEMKTKAHASASRANSDSAYWSAPELASNDFHRHTRKMDVWDFGVVFLQMTLGKAVTQQYSSPASLLDTMDMSPSSDDFVRKLFKLDSKKRPTAFDLLTCEFLRNNDPLLLDRSSPVHSRLLSSTSAGPLPVERAKIDLVPFGGNFSRYANEFHELGRLGKGGFGEVFKARNKLDGQLYAVKKITQTAPGSLSEILSETILLSRLNHPYVVRYFNTWLEEDFPGLSDTDEDAISFSESSISPNTGPSIQFGHSTGGLDIISSTRGPQVQFGYDTEDESSSAGEEDGSDSAVKKNLDASKEELKLKRTRSGTRIQRRSTLYIQMELCEKHTLRDLLRQGSLDTTEKCWRLFRQIIEGLNHIHAQGIIHRDLKPENVFIIDLARNPRIGDFGLATSGQYYLADRSSTVVNNTVSDLTRSIGTPDYVAPELRSSSANSPYNEKVDMYSLGIIFFEMCYPLKTGMERHQVLRTLRDEDFALPASFQEPEKALQGEIIKGLLHHRPSERPSTTELLHGGKIPLQIEDETIRQALQGFWDPNSPHYQKMMSALFSQSSKPGKDYAWDVGSTTLYGTNELLLQSVVKEKLVSVFRRHGAVETTRPLLFPRSNYYSANVVQLLDSSGNLLQLPYDLTLPYARLIAKQIPTARKTFAFGTVYRDLYTGEPPKGHGEVDFDIISGEPENLALKEAEVIKVIDEVLDAFPSLESAQMCFHINHSDLLDLIMDFCRVTALQRPAVKDIISKLNVGQWTWQRIRNELRSPTLGISSTSLDDLARFDFRDELEKVFHKLRTILADEEYLERCSSLFAHLSEVVIYTKKYTVRRKIYLSPLSSFNDKFYNGGVLFQCLYDGKKRDVFAAGGRYDRLVEGHRLKAHAQHSICHVVGFSLGWDKLWSSMNQFQKRTARPFLKKAEQAVGSQWIIRRCDVLVSSFDGKALRSAGIDIVRQLWANDISAELSIDVRSTDQLLSHYKDDKHSWIVIVKQDTGNSGERMLKVKSMIQKEDSDIRSSELFSWLRSEIRERDQREGTNDRARLLRTISQPETNQPAGEGEQDVRILISQYKGKKSTRKNVVEAAKLRAQELIQGFHNRPIAAIDVKDDILDAIRGTTVSDPDSWRKIIQSVPSEHRNYLGQVYELIKDIARDVRGVSRHAFIYNYRSSACIYYDLERTS